MSAYLLSALTYEEAAALQGDALVLLPLGSTEAHGPHLPLGTDSVIAEALAARLAAALSPVPSIIAPPLPFAVTECAAAFAGTVSLGRDTARALYVDACAGLRRAGFSRICLLSAHLEPEHIAVVREAQDVLRGRGLAVAFPDITERRFARLLTAEYRRGSCHAGRYETALVQAAQPGLVRESLRRTLPHNDADFLGALRAGVRDFAAAGGPRAYFGAPADATAQEGAQIYDQLVAISVLVLRETFPEWGDRLPAVQLEGLSRLP